MEVSSTMVRKSLSKGPNPLNYLSEGVYNYIEENNLYLPESNTW